MTSDKIYKLIEDNGLTLHAESEHFAALLRDHDRLYELLKRCEVEMRYAGWNKYDADNTARNGVYEQVKRTLYPDLKTIK